MAPEQPLRAEILFDCRERVVLVSGGGSGIGVQIARAFATNGAHVWITGRREDVLKRAVDIYGHEGSIKYLVMDVTDKQSILSGVERIKQEHGYLSTLVLNAGTILSNTDGDGLSVEQLSQKWLAVDADEWHKVFDVNVRALFYMAAAYLPLLKAGVDKHGQWDSSVLTISSISGITKTTQHGQFIYNSSKAAAISLSNMLATELLRPEIGIRCNSLSEMTTGAADPATQKSPEMSEKMAERWKIPAGRIGSEVDIAQTVLYLARCTYLNGVTVNVDGGHLLSMP